jgi:hypothetical protein
MPPRDQILAIYRAADAEVALAGPKCEASGRCCRFTEYGHTLFLSELEAEVLLATAPAYDQVTPDGCPFQVDGLCTARDERPLGCRVYFCDPSFAERMPVIIEKYTAQLKQLSEQVGRPWRYAPLQVFLQEALDVGRPRAENQSARMPLGMANP